MRLTMTAGRLWSCGLDDDQIEQFNDWVFDKTGYLETEVRRVSIVDEGSIEVERLVLGRDGYAIDAAGDLVWKVDTTHVQCLPPFLDRFEVDRRVSE